MQLDQCMANPVEVQEALRPCQQSSPFGLIHSYQRGHLISVLRQLLCSVPRLTCSTSTAARWSVIHHLQWVWGLWTKRVCMEQTSSCLWELCTFLQVGSQIYGCCCLRLAELLMVGHGKLAKLSLGVPVTPGCLWMLGQSSSNFT